MGKGNKASRASERQDKAQAPGTTSPQSAVTNRLAGLTQAIAAADQAKLLAKLISNHNGTAEDERRIIQLMDKTLQSLADTATARAWDLKLWRSS